MKDLTKRNTNIVCCLCQMPMKVTDKDIWLTCHDICVDSLKCCHAEMHSCYGWSFPKNIADHRQP